jgi:hypothetical protein
MLPSPFRALARGIVPEIADLDEAGWVRLEGIIEENLADRPEKLRTQLSLFIKVAGFLPRLRYGRSIESLSQEQHARYLESLQDSPLLLIRRGFWGLRTLVYMGFYCQDDVRGGIGYRATAAGWGDRSGATAAGESADD